MDESWWSRVLAGPGGNLRAESSDERYVVLPRSRDPRVVVDRASPLAMRDSLDRFVTARTQNRSVRALVGGGSS